MNSLYIMVSHQLLTTMTGYLEPTCKKLAPYSLRDGFKFVQKLDTLNACDKFILSFDGSSLFAKFPKNNMADIVCEYLSVYTWS